MKKKILIKKKGVGPVTEEEPTSAEKDSNWSRYKRPRSSKPEQEEEYRGE